MQQDHSDSIQFRKSISGLGMEKGLQNMEIVKEELSDKNILVRGKSKK